MPDIVRPSVKNRWKTLSNVTEAALCFKYAKRHPHAHTSEYQPGVYFESRDGDLAVWHDRSWLAIWRLGFARSFQQVHEWINEDLEQILKAASDLLEEARERG